MLVSQKYSLTQEQERLWIEWKLYPDSVTYNSHVIYKLTGIIDTEKLILSLKKAASDDIFHMGFIEEEGKTYQKKFDQHEPLVIYIELHSLEAIYNYINEAIKKPFNLKQPFPYRFLLIKQLASNSYYLGFVIHHILIDGRSFSLFLKKLSAYYNGESPNQAFPLDFTDYLMELPKLIDKKNSEDVCYWKNKLKTGLFPLETLLCAPKNKVSARHNFIIPGVMKKSLNALAIRSKSTLFLLLMAACKVLIHRYFSCEKLSLFYPVDVRSPRYKSVMGFFVNTLPITTQLDGESTFLELLQQITEQRKSDKKHQTLSLLTLFNFTRASGQTINSGDYVLFSKTNFFKNLVLRQITTEEITSNFYNESIGNLSFLYDDEGENIHFSVEYNETLFEKWFIQQFGKHFIHLLESIIKNPEHPVSTLPFIEKQKEKKETLINSIYLSPCIFVQTAIEEHAQNIPAKTAIQENKNSISYAEFNAKANQLARYLQKQGIKRHDFVAVLVNRSFNSLVALLAILKLGATYIPIDAKYPRQRQNVILEDSHCKYFFIPDDSENKIETPYPISVFYQKHINSILEKEKNDNLHIPVSPDDVMYVIYTSGTTGIPKGIPITYRNLSSLFTTTEPLFKFNKEDVWTLFHSLAFDFSIWEWCGSSIYGGKLVIIPYAISRSPAQFYQLLIDTKVTVLNQTPSAFYELIEVDKHSSDKLYLRHVIFGGEKLDYPLLSDWFNKHEENFPVLTNMYGITEGTIHVTFHKITKNDLNRHESLIGQPLPHMEAYVLDKNKQRMPLGCPGELYIAGLGNAKGYINRPDETAKRFIPNPYSLLPFFKWLYKTGDKAKILPTGDLIYLGRIDTQINFKGFRIELSEIESQLDKHPHIKHSVVLLQTKTDTLPQLVAYLILKQNASPTPFELRQSLLHVLPTYMVPTRFFQVDAIPLTINGKIDYAALSQLENHELSNLKSPQSTDSILARISEIWKNRLSLDEIKIHQNFFDSGGDSLLLVQVHHDLEQAFHYTFPPSILFSYPTIASLAEYFSALDSSDKICQKNPDAKLRGQSRLHAFDRRRNEKKLHE